MSSNLLIDATSLAPPSPLKRHRICMVSDFFYPNTGGVENHIYQLSQCLIRRGHKVVVITHAYGDRIGIRYLSNGLKVYYIPNIVMYNECTLPSIFTNLPLFRQIFIREQISVVHGHAAFSTLCHDAILHARTMGLGAVFTDHSLFGFADGSSILTNKFLKFTLSDVSHAICVSHTSRENTVLRSAISPTIVSVIPNAVDTSLFIPDPTQKNPNFVTIVIVSRLVYRKGMDLLAGVIPLICSRFPQVRFLIGGDGPKRLLLEEVREKYQLHERMDLIGHVPHHQVTSILNKGDIFLNTSLTEAFCIAIVEAACCGLSVVSTQVGGIPEVFPDGMLHLADPTVEDLVETLSNVIPIAKSTNPFELHERVSQMYSWNNIAERTEKVYNKVEELPKLNFISRLQQYYGCGVVAGKLFVMFVIINLFFYSFLEWFLPRAEIDICPDFDQKVYHKITSDSVEKSNESSVENDNISHAININVNSHNDVHRKKKK